MSARDRYNQNRNNPAPSAGTLSARDIYNQTRDSGTPIEYDRSYDFSEPPARPFAPLLTGLLSVSQWINNAEEDIKTLFSPRTGVALIGAVGGSLTVSTNQLLQSMGIETGMMPEAPIGGIHPEQFNQAAINMPESLGAGAGREGMYPSFDPKTGYIEWTDDSPRTLADFAQSAFYSAPPVDELLSSMVQPYTKDIWGADRPASQDIRQFGENVKERFYRHPVFLALDMMVVADGLGALGSSGLRSLGGVAKSVGRNADIASLTRAGEAMVDVAGGGMRSPVRLGNTVNTREYSANLSRQAVERLWDATGGRTMGGRAAEEMAFIPQDIYNKTLRPMGRAAEQLVMDRVVRYWMGQEEITTLADLTTFNRALKDLRPEDYQIWRDMHLNLTQNAPVNMERVAEVLRNKKWENGVALTESELRALNAAINSSNAWRETLQGHRALYKSVPGRYDRWIEREMLGPNTAEVLRGRENLPAETMGLSWDLSNDRFITGEQAAGLYREEVVPGLAGRKRLAEDHAEQLAMEVEKITRENVVPEPRGVDQYLEYKTMELGGIDDPFVIKPKTWDVNGEQIQIGGTGKFVSLKAWQEQQRALNEGAAEASIISEGSAPANHPIKGWKRFQDWQRQERELSASRKLAEQPEIPAEVVDWLGKDTPLAEAPGFDAPEVIRSPWTNRHRERLFTELGWKEDNPLRYMVDDGTLDYYDMAMDPIRSELSSINSELRAYDNIDPGAPMLMRDPQMDLPFEEPWFAPKLRLSKPPDPIAMRSDLALLSEHPELFEWVDGVMQSPIYYPHELAQDLVTGIADVMRAEESLMRTAPGFLKETKGDLFRRGVYDTAVDRVIRKNIIGVNRHEALTAIIDTIEKNEDATAFLAERHPDPRVKNLFIEDEAGGVRLRSAPTNPAKLKEYRAAMDVLKKEGYGVVYWDGFKRLVEGGKLQELIKDAATKLGVEYGSAQSIEVGLQRELIKTLTRETNEVLAAGRPVILPKSTIDHMGMHFGRNSVWFDMLVGGSAKWWRKFVLPLRLAWQINNTTSNFYTTAIHGNLGGLKYLEQFPELLDDIRLAKSGTVHQEVFGENFGYTGKVHNWLKTKGKVGEALIDFNHKVNLGVMKLVDMNQAIDNLFYKVNQLGQAERDLKAGNPLALRALQEAIDAVGGPGEMSIESIRGLNSTTYNFGKAMEMLYKSPKKPGAAGVEYLQSLQAYAAETCYRYTALAPWQKRYMTQIIPFSGWKLFTTGLLFRFPVKYPGRAFIMKTLGEWGQDYMDDLYGQAGIDPETLQDYERFAGVPILRTDDGKVISLRTNTANLYDAMGVEGIPGFLMTHPALKAGMEMFGQSTFPELHEMSKPERFGGELHGKHPFDAAGEAIFGPYWDWAATIRTPYKQFETGGLVRPEIRYNTMTGEPIPIENPIGSGIAKLHMGLTFTEMDSYDLMSNAHYGHDGSYTKMGNWYGDLDTAARADLQDRGSIRAYISQYIRYAQLAIDETSIMFEVAPDSEKAKLQSHYNTLMGQISRVMLFKAALDNPENEDMRIPPELLHGSSWHNPNDSGE